MKEKIRNFWKQMFSNLIEAYENPGPFNDPCLMIYLEEIKNEKTFCNRI